VWFLYLVPVLFLLTSVPFLFPHTQCKSTSIGLSTKSPTSCVSIFMIGSPNNCPSPQHPHTCRPTISNLFYLLHQTPFSFFPYALVVLLARISHKKIKKGVEDCENVYIASISAVGNHDPIFNRLYTKTVEI
jgi:hypothetical protein